MKDIKRIGWVRAVVLVCLGLVAAWSWLFVISKWGPSRRVDILTFKAGLTSKIMRTLLQPAHASGHHSHMSASISGIYATPEYYAMTEQEREAARYLPETFAVFYLFEDIHAGELPASPPSAILRLDDGRQFSPRDTAVLRSSSHHRATVVRFANSDEQGKPIIGGKTAFFEVLAHQEGVHAEHVMRWNLPIVYPKDLKKANDLSLPTLLALLAGLLAVLSPCLLQLTIFYTFALAGVSMQQGSSDIAGARAQVIRTALHFIVGFTAVFTASGALAGLAGEKVRNSAILENWHRPLSVAAGVGILLIAIWVGANSGAPGLCRLPVFATRRARWKWLDALKVAFMGSAFAIGCSTCFGGALFISLMIYVGAVGSTALGALALFLFSLGIAVPYLIAACFLSRALPALRSLHKVGAGVGMVSSVVLVFFGVILITDNFHVPSSLLYRLYLGL